MNLQIFNPSTFCQTILGIHQFLWQKFLLRTHYSISATKLVNVSLITSARLPWWRSRDKSQFTTASGQFEHLVALDKNSPMQPIFGPPLSIAMDLSTASKKGYCTIFFTILFCFAPILAGVLRTRALLVSLPHFWHVSLLNPVFSSPSLLWSWLVSKSAVKSCQPDSFSIAILTSVHTYQTLWALYLLQFSLGSWISAFPFFSILMLDESVACFSEVALQLNLQETNTQTRVSNSGGSWGACCVWPWADSIP